MNTAEPRKPAIEGIFNKMNTAKNQYFSHDGTVYTINQLMSIPNADTTLFNDKMCITMSENGSSKRISIPPVEPFFSVGERSFYIKDNSTGKIWSLPFSPVEKKYKDYNVSFGISDITWQATIPDFQIKIKLLLPENSLAERWFVSVKNIGDTGRNISLYTWFPFQQAMEVRKEAYFQEDINALISYIFPYYAEVNDYYLLKDKYNYRYLASDISPVAYETSLGRFLDGYSKHHPRALTQGKLSSMKSMYSNTVGVLQFDLELAANKKQDINLLCGTTNKLSQISKDISRYLCGKTFGELKKDKVESFGKISQKIRITTPDKNLNAYLNNWYLKQAQYNGQYYRFANQACIRNLIQDAMGLIYHMPEIARRNLLKVMEAQKINGSIFHGIALYPGVKVSDINLIPHRDMPVWWPIALYYYTMETGDLDILNETGGYYDDSTQESLFTHVDKGLEFLLSDLSERGLSLLGEGDWNDPLNMAGAKGKGESLWLSQALVYALNLWIKVSRIFGREEKIEKYTEKVSKLKENINKYGWDGNWYIRGTTDKGKPFGASKNREGKIFLNTQSWALISDVCSPRQQQKIIASVDKYLMCDGLPVTLFPPYLKMDENIGKLTLKAPGVNENGSVYSHAAVFFAYALLKGGYKDKAYAILRNLIPGTKNNPVSKCQQLPLNIPNCYLEPYNQHTPGLSTHVYGTGTISWLYLTFITEIIGFKAGPDGFSLKPALPEEWNDVKLVKNFRGTCYKIAITRKAGLPPTIKFNGVAQQDAFFPLQQKGTINTVEFVSGS